MISVTVEIRGRPHTVGAATRTVHRAGAEGGGRWETRAQSAPPPVSGANEPQ
jgi:hypothetical protein